MPLGWGQEIELCSILPNVSFSRDRKVDTVQTCTINVSLDDYNGHSYPQGWDEMGSRIRTMF